MESIEQFEHAATWTASEKKTARRAFDKAFERHCTEITAEAMTDAGERDRSI